MIDKRRAAQEKVNRPAQEKANRLMGEMERRIAQRSKETETPPDDLNVRFALERAWQAKWKRMMHD